jgi:hypothetical protein
MCMREKSINQALEITTYFMKQNCSGVFFAYRCYLGASVHLLLMSLSVHY